MAITILHANAIGLRSDNKVYNFIMHPQTHRVINPYFKADWRYRMFNLLENKILRNYE